MVTIEEEWIVFSFYRPNASSVCVAGDFNGWKTGDLELTPLGNGNWKAKFRLPPGEFKFRYCADGEWFTDYAACGVELGRFGLDSIVIVPNKPLRVAAEDVPGKSVFAA